MHGMVRVVLTTRTRKGESVRRRHCKCCEHRWYTVQEPEVVLQDRELRWAGRNVVVLT